MRLLCGLLSHLVEETASSLATAPQLTLFSLNADVPIKRIWLRPSELESSGRCRRTVTAFTTSGLTSCSLMVVKAQVVCGAATGRLPMPSRLTSSDTAAGHAEKQRGTRATYCTSRIQGEFNMRLFRAVSTVMFDILYESLFN